MAHVGAEISARKFNSTWCYTQQDGRWCPKAERSFKTPWFSKAARKALIADSELCSAMR
jgi:hypothetical protein